MVFCGICFGDASAAGGLLPMSPIAAPAVASKNDPGARAEDGAARFDFLMPVNRQWFRLREAAELIGMGETFIEKLFDEGIQLSGHEYNAGTGRRMTKRIPRAFVIALLLKSARYDGDVKLQMFLSCLNEFGPDRLRQIATAANGLCQQKSRQASAAAAGRATG
jgi:hypothetical protein